MVRVLIMVGLSALGATAAADAAPIRSQPQPVPIIDTIPAPRDIAYPGTMTIKIDASDIVRGIWRVEQQIPVSEAGALTLLFPKWLPGNHAPRGEIEKIVGLKISAAGKDLPWTRDLVDVHAFHIDVPAGSKAIELRFQFASATIADQGRIVATADMLSLQPNSVSFYPAGWFTRRIPVSAAIVWPNGWQAGGALRPLSKNGDTIIYETTDYETFVDSPFVAGRWFQKWDLGQNVSLDVVADEARFLAATTEQIDAHKRLVDQAVKLFGARHFDHYDFLLSLSDTMGGIGLEHHRSSENGVPTSYFLDWAKGPGDRNLLPHEFTHSWNGKYRRGADLFTADFRTPMRNSLLWVYEGQTQFWGYVLGARSGLTSKQDTLDALAGIAATQDNRPGRAWRSLDDTTNDPVISARRPKGWTSMQRSEDYYNEGMLIWLEADAIIRKESAGAKGMDDFARAFFGQNDGDWGINTYDFNQLVKTLNGILPYDWSTFLKKRLTEKVATAPLNGFAMSGYKLIYTDKPTTAFAEGRRGVTVNNLSYSGGLVIAKEGKVDQVVWESPAFDAGILVGDQIISVSDRPYSDEALKSAITMAKGGKTPIRLIIKTSDRLRRVDLGWYGGLRYPRFEKTGPDAALDRLLEPTP